MALEQGEAGHQGFHYALLQGIECSADTNRDGIVDIDILAKTVPEITERRWGFE